MFGAVFSGLRRSARLPNVLKNISGCRALNISTPRPVKQIVTEESGGTFTIRGVIVPSERAPFLIKPPEETPEDAPTETALTEPNKKCSLCALKLDLKHTDVLILSQFLRSDGCMLPKRVTGLCTMQQKKVSTLVRMAHRAGLMFNFTPKGCKRDKSRRDNYLKFNVYYDESTIFRKWKKPHFSEKFRR